MLIPYRAKNPPERFPAVTVSLLALNTLVYVVTSNSLLVIKQGVVHDFAVSHNTLGLFRILSAMFLHGDIFHLLGNMLFLWIFGSAAEGRLKWFRFLPLYLLAGVVGTLLQDVMVGIAYPKIFNLGASGAIMGLAGAYFFMFPYATICVVWSWGWRIRLADWQARWVILYFIAFDLLYGLLFQGLDGVGHFAHLGGFGAGYLGAMLLQMTRDSEDFAQAQAMRSDAGGNLQTLSLVELEALMESAPTGAQGIPLIMAFLHKALLRQDNGGGGLVFRALLRHERQLLEHADPEDLARIVLNLPETAGRMPASFDLRLGSRLETSGDFEDAMRMYRHAYQSNPQHADAEMALARLARLTEQTVPDKSQAASVYAELLRLFPNGPQSLNAQNALRRLGQPTIAFSAGNAAPASVVAAAFAAPRPVATPSGGAGMQPVGVAPAAATALSESNNDTSAPPRAPSVADSDFLRPLGD